eukprot:TRINITY_DN33991_c0_g1_i1.p1 TRINITY_DN33991_c0_g1~~TRINITY_DN33991_c0_g1_i1.p1  ORF type:complete len:883 (+),score=207.14 TRINITY_DN33991_c0_g1_i1:23-2671(+)
MPSMTAPPAVQLAHGPAQVAGCVPLAAQAAQAAQLHGVAAAKAAMKAQAHVHAAQAAHAIAASAAAQAHYNHSNAVLQRPQLQPQLHLQQPAMQSITRSDSARRSRERLQPAAVSVQAIAPGVVPMVAWQQHCPTASSGSCSSNSGSFVASGPCCLQGNRHFSAQLPVSRTASIEVAVTPAPSSALTVSSPGRGGATGTGAMRQASGSFSGPTIPVRTPVLVQKTSNREHDDSATVSPVTSALRSATPPVPAPRRRLSAELSVHPAKPKPQQEQPGKQEQQPAEPKTPPPVSSNSSTIKEELKMPVVEQSGHIQKEECQQEVPIHQQTSAVEQERPKLDAPASAEVPTSCSSAAEVSEAIRVAVAEGNVVALRDALPQAVKCCASWDFVEWAHEKCKDLEQEAWARRLRQEAASDLEDALQRSGAPPLSLTAACERAWEVGLEGHLVDKAREESGRRQLRESAEEALLKQLVDRSAPADILEYAIARAEKADVHDDLLKHAKRRLQDLLNFQQKQQARARGEQNLRDYLLSEAGLPALMLALDEAVKLGVSRKALHEAWERKVELELQAWQVQKKQLVSQRPSVVAQDNLESGTFKSSPANALCEAIPGPVDESSCRGRWTVPPRMPTAELCSSPLSSPAQPSRHVDPTGSSSDHHGRSDLASKGPSRSASRHGGAAMRAASVGLRHTATPRTTHDDLPYYGLDAELRAKATAKYDAQAEGDAAQWVEAVTGHEVAGNFFGALRSGEVLCQLVNCIRPNTILKINPSGMPFKERENICNFLKACRTLGVQEYAVFSTDDLYDEKNLTSVVSCIFSLGGAVQRSVPEFRGPHFGVVDTSNTKRDRGRDLGPATQTGGLHGRMERSHLDVISTAIVKIGGVGGC